jgi:hypothetical protein
VKESEMNQEASTDVLLRILLSWCVNQYHDLKIKTLFIHLTIRLFCAGSYGGWDENGYFVGYNGLEMHPAVSYNNSVLHKGLDMPFL